MDPVSHCLRRTLIAWAGTGRARDGWRGGARVARTGVDGSRCSDGTVTCGCTRSTHSIAGTLACACLTALVVRAARANTVCPPARAAWLGTASHVILIVSGARLRLGWPLSDRHWSLPLVAMATPPFLRLVAGVLLLSIARPPRHRTAAGAARRRGRVPSVKSILAPRPLPTRLRGGPRPSTPASRSGGTAPEWTVFDRADDGCAPGTSRPARQRTGPALAAHAADRPSAGASNPPTVRNFLHTRPGAGQRDVDGRQTPRCCGRTFATVGIRGPPAEAIILSLDDGRRLACGLWFGEPTGAPEWCA